ncbi:YbhB/YbcL family Raf kinase inhibitor-like protein [Frankia tisae]|uniref:YbhB/YbcL family Raf kinase inhibitor-like protein n=1 Tax=Frankia tisae TaxID=2950104 RepID=UPI0021C24A40|nr:hypothetical protein [Frankia tisae]
MPPSSPRRLSARSSASFCGFNARPGGNSLPEGAGDDGGSGLPAPAIQLPNDARAARFIGGAPPAGHGPDRYLITVHALDVEDIGVQADNTPAFFGFTIAPHILARATLTGTAETPAGR